MDAERAPPGAYRFDRFTLDLARGALLGPDGAELPLRPKSFALLRFLVVNPGQILGRDMIMEAVWPDVVVSDESITQCVHDIRTVLGDEGQRVLRTVPRRGYRFDAEVARAARAAAVTDSPSPAETAGSQGPPAPERSEPKEGQALPAAAPVLLELLRRAHEQRLVHDRRHGYRDALVERSRNLAV